MLYDLGRLAQATLQLYTGVQSIVICRPGVYRKKGGYTALGSKLVGRIALLVPPRCCIISLPLGHCEPIYLCHGIP